MASSAPPDPAPITLADLAAIPVERLSGVGPKKLDGLHKLGIDSLLDLLTHYPRRYLDRTNQAKVRDLRPGEEGMVLAGLWAMLASPLVFLGLLAVFLVIAGFILFKLWGLLGRLLRRV